jgi:microsomal dipeptidase-like Zn-dependent dipeptidase
MTLQIQELLHRGWTDEEIGDVMGGNLLRVMAETEEVQ